MPKVNYPLSDSWSFNQHCLLNCVELNFLLASPGSILWWLWCLQRLPRASHPAPCLPLPHGQLLELPCCLGMFLLCHPWHHWYFLRPCGYSNHFKGKNLFLSCSSVSPRVWHSILILGLKGSLGSVSGPWELCSVSGTFFTKSFASKVRLEGLYNLLSNLQFLLY